MKIHLANRQDKLKIPAVKIRRLTRKILDGEKIKKRGWLNFCFVDDRQIQKYNARFLKQPGPTDVLAFNLSGKDNPNLLAADIMISAQTALRQAATFKTSPEYELLLYVAHGILHILGYQDQKPGQIKQMRKKENLYVHR